MKRTFTKYPKTKKITAAEDLSSNVDWDTLQGEIETFLTANDIDYSEVLVEYDERWGGDALVIFNDGDYTYNKLWNIRDLLDGKFNPDSCDIGDQGHDEITLVWD